MKFGPRTLSVQRVLWCAALVLALGTTAEAAKLVKVTVTPATLKLAPNAVRQYRATAFYDNGVTQNVTDVAEWTTGDSKIAKVTATGLVTARDPGVVEIRAGVTADGKKEKGIATLTVDAGSIVEVITRPSTKKLEVGVAEQFKAKAVYSNGYEADITDRVNWSSTKPTIATVSNLTDTKGMVQPKKIGSTTITASDPISGFTNSDGATTVLPAVTSISFDETSLNLGRGMKGSLRVDALRSDGTKTNVTDEVTWTITGPSGIIQISTDEQTAGEVLGIANGTVQVNAVDEGRGLTVTNGPATVKVSGVLKFLVVEPDPFNVSMGEERNARAFGITSTGLKTNDLRKSVTWQVSNANIAQVGNADNNRGIVTPLSEGTTTLRAIDPTTQIASTETGNLVVGPPELPPVAIITRPSSKNLDNGRPEQFKARAVDANQNEQDITERVTWTSTNTAVATVSADGMVTPRAVGTTTIRAFDPESGLTNTDGLTTVKAAVSRIAFDETLVVLGRLMNGALRVDAYRVDGTKTNITDDVDFFLSTPDIIKLSEDPEKLGTFRTLKNGSVVVNAVDAKRNLSTANGGGPAVVRVEGTLVGLEIKPAPLSLSVGDERGASAFGLLNSGSKTTDLRESVDWSIDDEDVAVLGTEPGDFGRVKGVAIGTTTIRAREPSSGIETTATNNVVVRGAITDIKVDPEQIVVGRGVELLIGAIANREDGTTSNLTDSVEWTTEPAGIVTIEDGGVLRGVKNGTATIRAFDPKSGISSNDSGQNGTVAVSGILTGLEVRPDPFQIPVATRRKAHAIGLLSGSIEETSDLRDRVTWSIDDPTIAQVGTGAEELAPDGEPLDAGEVYGLVPGHTVLRAKDPRTGHENSSEVSVLGEIASIKLETSNSGLAPINEKIRYKVRATYANKETANISDKCEWSVDNPAIATVDNELPDKGQIQGVQVGGKTMVRVDCDGMLASADVQAVGTPIGFRVDPAEYTGRALASRRFRAWVQYEGGPEADITNTAVWFSTNPGVASVDNEVEKGRVRFLTIGTTSIVAVSPAGPVASSEVSVDIGVLSLKIVPNEKTIRTSTGLRLKVIAKLSDAREELVTQDVEWSTTNADVARVSDRPTDDPGLVLAGAIEGTATITAKILSGLMSATSTITTDTLLTSLTMKPASKHVGIGKSRRVVASGLYDDGKNISLTRYVEFISSNPDVATVESHGTNPGRVIGVGPGTATITAVDPASGIVSSNGAEIIVP